MATYPLNGWVLLSSFGGSPVDPQPSALDGREPPEGHYGLPVRSPDGKVIQGWYPQTVGAASPKVVDRLTFLRMFTNAERAAAKLSTEPNIVGLWPLFDSAAAISVLDPDIQAAFSIFVFYGIMTSERVAEIVNDWPTA